MRAALLPTRTAAFHWFSGSKAHEGTVPEALLPWACRGAAWAIAMAGRQKNKATIRAWRMVFIFCTHFKNAILSHQEPRFLEFRECGGIAITATFSPGTTCTGSCPALKSKL